MNVIQRSQCAQGDLDGPLGRQLSFFRQNFTQKAAVAPLHNHIKTRTMVVVGKDPHYVGVIERRTDLFFALESIKANRVLLQSHIRNLDGNRLPRSAYLW